MSDETQPALEGQEHELPEEVLDVLVNLGQQHPMGKLALRCWVLGKGLPSEGGFAITVKGTYQPKPMQEADTADEAG